MAASIGKENNMGFFDGKGIYRNKFDGGFDARGIWRSCGEGGYDSKGYYRDGFEGWSVICY